jgi:hypothetical protein
VSLVDDVASQMRAPADERKADQGASDEENVDAEGQRQSAGHGYRRHAPDD